VEEIISEGNPVATRWHSTGTHKGEYLGQPATGNKVAVDGVSIDRIEKGMFLSVFDAWVSLGFSEQIGLI
jgi:predicted ester cyclase